MSKLITARELGEILGISERRVNQIVTEKQTFERELNGKFDVVKCVEAYYRDMLLDVDYKADLDRERALHEKAKREKSELLLQQMKNELHWGKDVELILTDMLVTFRNRVLGVPATVASKLVNKNIPEIIQILTSELKIALTELSGYNPERFGGCEHEVNQHEPNHNNPISENS